MRLCDGEPGKTYEVCAIHLAMQMERRLEALGLTPSYENAIYLQILKKAAGGDFTAAKYVLENAGREPPEEEAPVDLQALPTAVLLRLAGALPEVPP